MGDEPRSRAATASWSLASDSKAETARAVTSQPSAPSASEAQPGRLVRAVAARAVSKTAGTVPSTGTASASEPAAATSAAIGPTAISDAISAVAPMRPTLMTRTVPTPTSRAFSAAIRPARDRIRGERPF